MTTIIILLAVIAILLLVIVIQFGVFLNRDGTVWLGSKLSSINSKAQSIVDEVVQTNAKIYEIENDMNEHGIAQAKWFDSMSKILTTIANHTNETTNKVAELVDFEKRNEQRNDEMYARCEEINKLQLAELRKKAHTDDDELLPPKEECMSLKIAIKGCTSRLGHSAHCLR